MSKFIKLPDKLKNWKINSLVASENNCEVYKVSKTDSNGVVINALLRHIFLLGDGYNEKDVDFFEDEAEFLSSVSKAGDCFVYLDIVSENQPSKNKYDLYLVTEELKTLAEVQSEKKFDENDIIDFGIQLSGILELIESKNIFHGNINPENIFVTPDGKYKLGGFSDFESKIADLSYVAPEVYRKENADFTTDIYSLGMIMYAMCSDGKLPFENDAADKAKAIEERMSGKAITAPQNGSEKLKSVVVIACQFNNANRWKNAGNIKNALSSLKSTTAESEPKENPAVIPPAPTDFDGNVFEEFEYEEYDEPATTSEQEPAADSDDKAEQPLEDENGYEVAEVTEAESFADEEPKDEDTAKQDSPVDDANKNEPTELDTIVSADVLDEYAEGAVKKDFKKISEERDYGNYFDDDEPVNAEKSDSSEAVEEKDKNTVEKLTGFSDNNTDVDDNDYAYEDYDDYDEEPKDHSKRNIAIVIVCIVVILAALGFVAYCALTGVFGKMPWDSGSTPSTTAAQTTAQQTTQPTTAAPTTTQPATKAKATVTPVVGYGYSYGKELLEQEGFKVEISEYRESYYYDEGYIIEQSPEGETEADKGSVVSLVISSGRIEEETEPEQSSESSENNGTDDSYILPNSDSTYLSNAQVDALSDEELQLAINEIYARHGRIFNDSAMSEYFNSKSWYEPQYTAEEFEQNVTFNTYEQKNLQLMIDERQTR